MTKAERNAKIVELVSQRQRTMEDIASEYGITRERVRQIAARADVVRGARMVLSDDVRDTAASLLRRGVPIAHIAAQLGHKSTTIRGFLLRERHHRPVNNMTPWTPAEEETVRREYLKTSARILAQRLGRTRNEIIGKAHRLQAEARAS